MTDKLTINITPTPAGTCRWYAWMIRAAFNSMNDAGRIHTLYELRDEFGKQFTKLASDHALNPGSLVNDLADCFARANHQLDAFLHERNDFATSTNPKGRKVDQNDILFFAVEFDKLADRLPDK